MGRVGMSFRIGIDIGGTFTDFAIMEEATGRLWIHKQLTTPDDPSAAVLDGLGHLLAKAGVSIGAVGTIVHGSTLVTNAVIERRGCRTGMLVTKGFRDVLDIAMERRYDVYDLRLRFPAPIVPRALRTGDHGTRHRVRRGGGAPGSAGGHRADRRTRPAPRHPVAGDLLPALVHGAGA